MKLIFPILGFIFLSYAAYAVAEQGIAVTSSQNIEKRVCNPVVTVKENNKSRFEILKSLAEVHGFSISILESEDSRISLEKTDTLSRIVESITRDMSVVLRYKTEDDCKVLTQVAFLDNKAWDNVGGAKREFAGRKRDSGESFSSTEPSSRTLSYGEDRVKRAQADMTPRPVSVEELAEAEQSEEEKERLEQRRQARILAQERQEALRKQRMESRGQEYQPPGSINDSIEGGENLNALYRAGRANWRGGTLGQRQLDEDIDEDEEEAGEQITSGLGIEDMDTYVREVLAGERMPETGSMNAKERFEYMKARQRIRNE